MFDSHALLEGAAHDHADHSGRLTEKTIIDSDNTQNDNNINVTQNISTIIEEDSPGKPGKRKNTELKKETDTIYYTIASGENTTTEVNRRAHANKKRDIENFDPAANQLIAKTKKSMAAS